MVLRKGIRNRKIKKLFQPHSGRNDINEAILIHFGSNKAILILFLAKLRKLKAQKKLKNKNFFRLLLEFLRNFEAEPKKTTFL